MTIKTILTTCFYLVAIAARSQKNAHEEEHLWRMTSVTGDMFVYNEIEPEIQNSVIYQGDTAAIMPVYFSKEKDGLAITKVGQNGNVSWQTPIEGSIVGLCWLNGNILAFTKASDKENSNSLTVFQINPGTGRLMKQKVVFHGQDGTNIDIRILNTPDGQFCNVLVRTTPDKGKRTFRWQNSHELFEKTEKLSIIYLNEKLDIRQNLDKNNYLKDLDFRGSVVNRNQEIFLLGHRDDKFVVQKISARGELLGTLSTTVKLADDRLNMSLAAAADEQNTDAVFVSLSSYSKGDRAIYTFLFDFAKNTVLAPDPVKMDKSYAHTIESFSTKNIAKTNLSLDELRPVAVLQADSQFIVIKNVTGFFTTSKGWVDASELIVVSFYDKNLHLTGETAIDKTFIYYWSIGCSLGFHLKDNKLLILTAANTAREKYVNLKASIDLSTKKVTELTELPALGNERRKFAEGAGTFWFGDHFIISQVTDIGVVVRTAKTVYERYDY